MQGSRRESHAPAQAGRAWLQHHLCFPHNIYGYCSPPPPTSIQVAVLRCTPPTVLVATCGRIRENLSACPNLRTTNKSAGCAIALGEEQKGLRVGSNRAGKQIRRMLGEAMPSLKPENDQNQVCASSHTLSWQQMQNPLLLADKEGPATACLIEAHINEVGATLPRTARS